MCFGGLDAVLSGDFLHGLTTADVADEVVQAADVLVSEVDAGELGVASVQLDGQTQRGLLVGGHACQVHFIVLDVVGLEEELRSLRLLLVILLNVVGEDENPTVLQLLAEVALHEDVFRCRDVFLGG